MVGHAVAFDGGNGFIGGEVGFSPSSFFTAGYRNADDPGRAVSPSCGPAAPVDRRHLWLRRNE